MGRRKKGECPSLRRHVCGQGIVTLNEHDHYLGVWPEGQRSPPGHVQAEYDRLIAEWLARGRMPLPRPAGGRQCGPCPGPC
jgi:hypothetical protein